MEAVKNKLKINAVLVQIPVGVETEFEGVIDLIKMEFILFEGPHGATVVREKIPEKLLKDAVWHRCRLIEALADVFIYGRR